MRATQQTGSSAGLRREELAGLSVCLRSLSLNSVCVSLLCPVEYSLTPQIREPIGRAVKVDVGECATTLRNLVVFLSLHSSAVGLHRGPSVLGN